MADEKLPDFDFDNDEPTLLSEWGGLPATETIDLDGMIAEMDGWSSADVPETGVFQATSFGKLMEALPIPALMIDPSRKILFANQCVEMVAPESSKVQGNDFSSLFPDKRAVKKVKSLVDKVFKVRKTEVIEAVVQIGPKKIWGRVHIRSLRLDQEQSLLVLIEDRTHEKTQIALHEKLRKELEHRVEARTADLKRTNQRLKREINERKRAEQELQNYRQQLEELVAERTSELNNTIKRLKREVRDRKKAEESLRTSERRFNVAFRANPGAVSIASLDTGRFLEVNDGFCKATGYTREEVIGRTATELNYWADRKVRERMVRRLTEKGAVQDFEAVFCSKDGRLRVGRVSAELIDLDGKPHVLTVSTDVTDRKRAEMERERLTTAIEQVAESILITDSKGTITYTNPAFRVVSGYEKGEILGRHINTLRSGDNDDTVLTEAKTMLGKGSAWKGRVINLRKDDVPYVVETTVSPMKGKTGRTINFVVVERDVTNEVRMESQLRQAQKMQAIGTLAGGIAHDFNNMLMSIIGYTHLAQEQLPEENPANKDLANALKVGDRARNLINQILTFSRQAEQELRPLEVQIVFKEALKLLRASIPKTIEIVQDFDAMGCSVMADPTQIHQVMMNLCTNAYQAMEGTHGTLSVSLSRDFLDERDITLKSLTLEPGACVRLTVGDTGHGMKRSVMERIFEPYYTTKELGEGTGMGLAVVHGIVSALGGGITVESEIDEGSKFHVYLPLCEESTEADDTETTKVTPGTERILFVDDEEEIVDICSRVLGSLGYDVSAIRDPREALGTFMKSPHDFDLVVTDLSMPHITGLELAEALMAIRRDIPIILCTGFSDTVTNDRVRELGIKKLLIKPVVPKELGDSVRRILATAVQDSADPDMEQTIEI